jgi:acyl-coenzyme A thioesterase PaaI-like protein
MSRNGPPANAERQDLADRSRELLDRLVSTQAPTASLERAAALVSEAAALLAEHVPDGPRDTYGDYQEGDDYLHLFRLNPVIGPLNPIAPRFDLELRDDGPGLHGREVVVRMNLGLLYEGPQGQVHGGVIASLFDQFLGIANIDNGLGAFTGTLTVRYHQPCPIETDLVLRGRTDRVEGRKVFAVGELHAGEVLVAEAEGIFVQPSLERLAALIEGPAQDGPTPADPAA